MAEPRRSTAPTERDLEDAYLLLVEARFYDDIADSLLTGAKRAIDAAGAKYDVITVPGSLEIPAAIAIALDGAAACGKHYDGAVALGCVIRGDTIHFEIVSNESARALMELSVSRGLPLGNGIITVDTEAQAWARAKVDDLDKGGDAARAALTMIRIKRRAYSGAKG
jgi:6,7-dimethyl-8-ribityllumazine synthase